MRAGHLPCLWLLSKSMLLAWGESYNTIMFVMLQKIDHGAKCLLKIHIFLLLANLNSLVCSVFPFNFNFYLKSTKISEKSSSNNLQIILVFFLLEPDCYFSH